MAFMAWTWSSVTVTPRLAMSPPWRALRAPTIQPVSPGGMKQHADTELRAAETGGGGGERFDLVHGLQVPLKARAHVVFVRAAAVVGRE
jgi:hypothetical protein